MKMFAEHFSELESKLIDAEPRTLVDKGGIKSFSRSSRFKTCFHDQKN